MCSSTGVNPSMTSSSSAMCGHCLTHSRRLSKMEIWQSCRNALKHYTGCWIVTSDWRRDSAQVEAVWTSWLIPQREAQLPFKKEVHAPKGEPLSFSFGC